MKEEKRFLQDDYMLIIFELLLWGVVAFVVSGRFWFIGISEIKYLSEIGAHNSYGKVLSIHYFDVLFGLLFLLFPIIFRLIFGALPLEVLRTKRVSQLKRHFTNEQNTEFLKTVIENETQKCFPVEADSVFVSEGQVLVFFDRLVASSRNLAGKIFTRAGIYLLVGVLVAFSGLAFFYLQSAVVESYKFENFTEHLISVSPRFGVLFFIETIAFFFLRQYRAAMDEFRYFEAIQRNREETLGIIRLLKDSGKEVDPLAMVKEGCFYSHTGKLAKGETTELIETRKLDKDQTELIEKIIQLVLKTTK